jgi:hypothetical protein
VGHEIMMKPPSLQGAVLMLLAGGAGTFVWMYLFGLWVTIDTPLLKVIYELRLWPSRAPYISLSLFSMACAALFVFPIWFFMRRTLIVSAAIFITAFLAVFIVPVVMSNEPEILDALSNISALWLFVFGFVFLVFLASRFTNERQV